MNFDNVENHGKIKAFTLRAIQINRNSKKYLGV